MNNCTEITNMTDAEFELLMAQKTLEAITPETNDTDWLNDDFAGFTIEQIEAEPTENELQVIELHEKIETLTAQVEAERIESINTKIEENNKIIAELREKIGALKPTKAGKSFLNFYTGKYQFMTFTEINAAKINNEITCILNETKDLQQGLN